ncbi:LuxR family maltose regulon positive regulatory protein [Kribbella orskensis]|uniref:LuxR family maltose regulon positive regulatory protein n=1 Tax=Kribbella orskensis TaxID=2512216 RepID=A0ABY2BAW6_9ACTN|nr:LuxR family maltose regulon positive regulatory protein [Kribbella sp. VKM Ac-2500]TCO13265.1 LuxR family maltose regulon positive regulatory protein [Kribbella orskensis]
MEKRVTVISAPAGSGKTSLLRAWADRRRQDRRIAFLSVKPGQHDAQLFWLSVLGAVRGTEDPATAPGFNGQAMVDRVLTELAAYGEPFVLIIDDLHELTSTEANEQLTALLTHLPADVHAVVATRRDLPLRLHQLRLAGGLAEIRAAQLLFTEDETRKLLAVAGITLPDQVVTTLYQRTEGWAAGLRLAVLSLAGHPEPERFVAEFSGSDRTVAEYLMAEMLDHQPPEVQRLLLRTSLLDRVNGELADLLTGAAGSERILLDLEDANAFVVSLDPARTWFRYHHMFSGLLGLELRRTAPGDVPELHRIAARWFANHGDTPDAIRHLQAAGDWTEAARLLTDHALSLTLDGQAGTVAVLLHTFPARIGEDFPGLALVHAIADLDQLHLDQADAHLEVVRAYAATTPSDRQHQLRMALACLDLLLARLRGHFDSVFEQVDALPATAVGQSTADVALGNDLRSIALLNLGVTEAWSLRLAESEKSLLEGAALARDIGRPYLEVACLAHLGFATTGQSFALARQHCENAIAQAARHGWDAEPVIAPAQATLAGILVSAGEFDRGEEWLERARRATEAGGEPGLRLLIHLITAILRAARGRHREALAELIAAEQRRARITGKHALTSRVTGWTIATQARLGNVDQARATLAAVDDQLATAGEIRNAAAVIRLAEHDPAAAHRELQPVLDRSAPDNPYATLIEAHLLDALACRDLGDERAARAAVEQALHLAEPDRLIVPFAMTGAWELLTALPPHGTSHAALVADILDAVHGDSPTNATAPAPVENLSPTELRVLRYLPTNLTRPEIATELSVSLNTVNTHIRRIYAKLGATDRSSAVQRGRDLRLLSSGRA